MIDKKSNISDRMSDIKPFHVMKILARARQLESEGHNIIHMEVGEPDFDTPPAITQAGISALQQGYTHYTPATGLPRLKQVIADYYRSAYAVEVSPSRVIITPGSSGALQLLMSTLINPGEAVLLTDPGYPCNRHFVRLVEGEPISVPVSYETGFQINKEVAEQYWQENVRAVMLASPSNPTGSTITLDEVKQLAGFLDNKDAYLIMDEIYQGLNYGEESITALQANIENLFVVNSFSKFFGMTGWRLGWMIVPDEFADPVDRLAQNIFLAPQTMAQHAAMEAFKPETLNLLRQRRDEFLRRRDFLLPAMQALGFKLRHTPQGAFYLYMDCSALTNDSYMFSVELLEKAGVAITPGLDFGTNQPEKYVRFAFTTAIENLKEGVRRIEDFLNT